MTTKTEAIDQLRTAFQAKKLTLYLGAGVSIGSNLPSWDKLVLGMYFNKISEAHMGGWRPFSNYLYAISEWYLKTAGEPLEITARKLQKFYGTGDRNTFLQDLYDTLYGNFFQDGERLGYINSRFIRAKNPTLKAIARLCQAPNRGVANVVTYNYDNLLEMVLTGLAYQTVFRATELVGDALPIYHVHGFVPMEQGIPHSTGEEIVFTEEEYHRVAESPFYWSNLIQLQLLSSTTGLMVGLSLSDRNMRRILDAIDNSPLKSQNFALLKEPDKNGPEAAILDAIHTSAKSYRDRCDRGGIKRDDWVEGSGKVRIGSSNVEPPTRTRRAGVKRAGNYQYEISGIIQQVKKIDREQQEYVLGQLGVTPIWIKDYSEIPGIIAKILQ